MAVHPIDFRYGSREMRAVFEEEARLANQLKVEAALAGALADLGAIPKKAADEIASKANTKNVRLERVKEIEGETRHDVMAMVKALTEQCGDAGKYVHLTATSSDVVDTAQALQLKAATGLLLGGGQRLLKTMLAFAEKHKRLVMVGRTHGQHAIPITLGFKFANYADKLGEDLERIREDEKFFCGKFSGAVGTYSAQQSLGLGSELEDRVMERVGLLAADVSMQVVPRENVARVVCDVAVMAGTLEQVAKEVRNLQRPEIGELSEAFGEKQVGSSAMAQKRNPVSCENVCSNARVIRSCVGPALENISLEHERDLTNSACERSVLPTVFLLADEVVSRLNKVVGGAVVFPENMKKNLELSRGTIMAERTVTELVKKGVGRQDAHELVRAASMKAFRENKQLRDVLDLKKHFSRQELARIFDYESYVGLAVEKTEQVVKKWKKQLVVLKDL